jgi:hypothetical protein
MPSRDESPLERMNERLYDPGASVAPASLDLSARRAPAPRAWAAPPPPPPRAPKKKLPLAVKFLIGAGVFFVLAALLGAYLLLVGGRTVSTNNINISVDGPANVAGGGTVSLLVTVENHNPVAISDADFTVDWPAGTRSPDDATKPLTQYEENLGDLGAGQAVTRTVKASLFGTDNQILTIPVKLTYKTENSNAVFVKEKDYPITIGTSPVTVTATSVSEVSSGQAVTFSLSVRSNATTPLADIALSAQYPFGFSVSTTSLPSTNGLFTIGTLAPGAEKKVTVTGTLTGSNNDERVFHWAVGSTASSTNGALGVPYSTIESDVTITQPFFGLALSLNNSTADAPVVSAGKNIQGLVKWTNSLKSAIRDGQVTVAFTGSALDPSSVTTQNGFYQSSNGTIRFDASHNTGLGNLAPGDTGTGVFAFAVKNADDLRSVQNPSVTVTLSASGSQDANAGASGTLTSTVTRTIRIATDLSVDGDAGRIGPNPAVGVATPYTVTLSATNDLNAVAGATVTAVLPSYVTYVSSTDSGVSYSDSSHAVTWTIGNMAAGGTNRTSFQVTLLPSASQSGEKPILVNAPSITGTDRFTQTAVTATGSDIQTDSPVQ